MHLLALKKFLPSAIMGLSHTHTPKKGGGWLVLVVGLTQHGKRISMRRVCLC